MRTSLPTARKRRSVAAALVAAATAASALSGCTSDDASSGSTGLQARMLPPIADAGEKARGAKNAEVVIEGSADEPDEGAEVSLQVRDGDAWTDLDSAEQDEDGRVVFTAPNLDDDDHPQTYRLVSGDEKSSQLDTAVWKDKLLFEDAFDGSSLGDAWSHRLQGYEAKDRSCSKPDESMVEVRDGVAELSVVLDPKRSDQCRYEGDDYDYRLNANIGTQGTFDFTYGYAAARVKFHKQRGQHGAFWLQPTPREMGSEDVGAEIDVIEWFGKSHHSGLASYIHYFKDGELEKAGSWIKDPERYGDDWWKRYHVFSVEWTADAYTFRIDGQVTSVLDDPQSVANVPEYLILSNLSSDYELKHLPEESALPQTTKVDWVRAWAS